METVEAANVSLPENAIDLGFETEVRRWLVASVDLEILCDRVDPLSEPLQQLRVRRLRGSHPTRQEQHGVSSRHSPRAYSA
jgi:hypothetical protein